MASSMARGAAATAAATAAGAGAAAARPPSLTLLGAGATPGARRAALGGPLQARRRDVGAARPLLAGRISPSGMLPPLAASNGAAAGRRRRRQHGDAGPPLPTTVATAAAAAAAAAGAAGAWPTPASAASAEVAASAAAAALEAAAHQADGDAEAAFTEGAAAAGPAPAAAPGALSSSSPPASSSSSFASASSASLASAPDSASPASSSPSQDKASSGSGGGSLAKRVASGVLLGAGGAAVVAAGGVPFLCAALFVTFHATREFYGLLTSRGLSKGMTPPGPVVSAGTTALCLSIALLTHATSGRSAVAMAVAGFVLLSLNLFSSPKPKFAQLTSSLFGLFYCGYLPSFWIKLRAVASPLPADAPIAALLPAWLLERSAGGATVGLAVTLTAVACVIAADTGAYFVGKSLGRTKLTDISPKKTVEGAIGGLASSVATALILQASLTGWPAVPVAAAAAAGLHFPQAAVPWAAPLLAAAFGAAVFVSSILGDLIESIIKREAGQKDSGDLIPGHGGLLDRFDSYIFTGALAYGFVVFGHLF